MGMRFLGAARRGVCYGLTMPGLGIPAIITALLLVIAGALIMLGV